MKVFDLSPLSFAHNFTIPLSNALIACVYPGIFLNVRFGTVSELGDALY